MSARASNALTCSFSKPTICVGDSSTVSGVEFTTSAKMTVAAAYCSAMASSPSRSRTAIDGGRTFSSRRSDRARSAASCCEYDARSPKATPKIVPMFATKNALTSQSGSAFTWRGCATEATRRMPRKAMSQRMPDARPMKTSAPSGDSMDHSTTALDGAYPAEGDVDQKWQQEDHERLCRRDPLDRTVTREERETQERERRIEHRYERSAKLAVCRIDDRPERCRQNDREYEPDEQLLAPPQLRRVSGISADGEETLAHVRPAHKESVRGGDR